MPEAPQPRDSESVQEGWNETARAEAIAEFGALTAVQIDASHRRGTTESWLRQRRVFSVPGPEGPLLPGFQFRQGETRPVIAEILEALDGQLNGWEILLWFTGPSGSLDGRRPVDVLTSSPEQAVFAAAYQASLSHD